VRGYFCVHTDVLKFRSALVYVCGMALMLRLRKRKIQKDIQSAISQASFRQSVKSMGSDDVYDATQHSRSASSQISSLVSSSQVPRNPRHISHLSSTTHHSMTSQGLPASRFSISTTGRGSKSNMWQPPLQPTTPNHNRYVAMDV
jgi:hypothetical protein